MYYSVVAIEGERFILEDDEQNIHIILREQVGYSVKEGDVLILGDNVFVLDEIETEKRKELVNKLLEGLLRTNGEEEI